MDRETWVQFFSLALSVLVGGMEIITKTYNCVGL